MSITNLSRSTIVANICLGVLLQQLVVFSSVMIQVGCLGMILNIFIWQNHILIVSSVLAMPYFITQYTGLPKPASDAPKATLDAFVISASNQSLTTSILSCGTFFGALIAGDVADTIGRRLTIIAGCLVFCVGCILETASTGLSVMVAGRLIAGLGVGFISAISKSYEYQLSASNCLTSHEHSHPVHVGNCSEKSPRCPCIRISILCYHRNFTCQLRCVLYTKSD